MKDMNKTLPPISILKPSAGWKPMPSGSATSSTGLGRPIGAASISGACSKTENAKASSRSPAASPSPSV